MYIFYESLEEGTQVRYLMPVSILCSPEGVLFNIHSGFFEVSLVLYIFLTYKNCSAHTNVGENVDA